MDGILNVDKPEGITSMDVVRRIKRASAQKRVGHGGTLDPIAMGVVPVCIDSGAGSICSNDEAAYATRNRGERTLTPVVMSRPMHTNVWGNSRTAPIGAHGLRH